jgi:hypothetical protein
MSKRGHGQMSTLKHHTRSGRLRTVWFLALGIVGCVGQTAEPAPTSTTVSSAPVPPSVPDIEAAPVPDDRLRVLFIGNSYTYVNALPFQIQRVAESAGAELPLEVVSVTPGGMTLEHHWTSGAARRLIRQGGWTHVVLQEQSTRPIDDPATFQQYARMFDEEIDRVGAQTVLYLTWARQHRPTSQDSLSHQYLTAGQALDARVAPVGIAWQLALAEDPSLVLHYEDRSHPEPTGTYLAALVFYATLFDASPVGVSPRMWSSDFGSYGGRQSADETDPLPEATAELLQRIALEAVGSVAASANPGPGGR